VWEVSISGMEGIVKNQVLDRWEKLDQYHAPDANIVLDRRPAEWDRVKEAVARAKKNGELTTAALAHGFLFLRILYLRGFSNAMIDFAEADPHLLKLIEIINNHNKVIVSHYIKMGVDVMLFGDDLGTQSSTILSPQKLREYIFPSYKELFDPCKRAGMLIEMHSDGRTLDILEDQVKLGVDIVNPQDLCNGIDNLANTIKGKACINLDVDRQTILPFGNEKDIDDLIREEVMKLGSRAGGLSFIAGIYPPTPPRNVESLCKAFRKYSQYWQA
jgi:uroporphyrinogen decarboxylase